MDALAAFEKYESTTKAVAALSLIHIYDKEVLFSAGSSQKRDATSRVWCAYL